MPCDIRSGPGDIFTVSCSRDPRPQRCRWCAKQSSGFCDFRETKDNSTAGNPSATCDAPFCLRHGQRIAPNMDYCQEHRIDGARP